ncbi:transglutaminase-like domain-containing protein [Sorangium sp. So ce131]|uniref:transglutaminase-like domain-containing protein n=1 Tax=Sorangium sp. So ce131 TaxID=3133282 RepID=UPI003F616749
MTTQQILDFYRHPAAMTSGGEHAPALEELPRDVAALARVVQGLLLHQYWAPSYGVTIPDERRGESHVRPTRQILEQLLARGGEPLSAARPADARFLCICRHFTLLLTAMLRDKGVPARARVGFGAYFTPDQRLDHWVCEYWNAEASRWILVDPQLDDVQKAALKLDFDPLDVPRDRFLIAGDAWAQCRAGEADPATFGIFDMHGLWFIAGNLVRDVASLNKVEMLPWDDWGAMVGPDDPLDDARLAFFDRLAAITRAPDASFAELRALYEGDEGLRVPATVFNAVLNRPETV